jgi:hypothetical protein
MPVTSRAYKLNVFINCPFDSSYRPILNAIIFAVQFAGFRPRCALEASNAGDAYIYSRYLSSNRQLPRLCQPPKKKGTGSL